MNDQKEAYVRRIRAESAYPAFRKMIRVFEVAFYLLAGIMILGALGLGRSSPEASGSAGLLLLVAMAIIFVGRVVSEVSSILADVADAITDASSHWQAAARSVQ
jgi:uncharacterized membrane protein